MSELINQNRRSFRWQLLTTVSALSLGIAISAHAEPSDKPSVWIELGGQLERIDGKEDPYLPPFTTLSSIPGPYSKISPSEAQKASIYSYGAEGKITFQPHGSKWDFTAGIRYGRSSNNKHTHEQTTLTTTFPNPRNGGVPAILTNAAPQFADFRVKNAESHTVLDFQAGRDVGLGVFSYTASFGIRVADFSSTSQVNIIARPNVVFHRHNRGLPGKYYQSPSHNDYKAFADNQRNFHGIGPSLAWNGNVRVLGDEDGGVTFDWGANAAVLFGRQKAKGLHQESAYFESSNVKTFAAAPYGAVILYNRPPLLHDRSRSIVVPNVGGLAGISFRYPGTKVSFGYRADFFFGAMDMGIDARNTKDRNFYGPFATVSIGLGG